MARGLSWSPDGRWIAAAWKVGDTGPRSVHLVDSAAESEVRRLTVPPEGWFGDVNPAFSPDGDHVAFVRSSVGGHVQDVYLVPVTGGEPRRLTFDNKPVRGLVWRDRAHLMVASKRSHEYAIWQLAVETGEIWWTGIAPAGRPRASASSRRIRGGVPMAGGSSSRPTSATTWTSS